MTQTLDLNKAEKQAFRLATFEDGILEIYLGSFFVLMSFYSITRALLGPVLNAALILGLILILVGLVWIAKKRIILPRIGLVKFGSQTKKKIRAATILTWGLVLGTFALMILAATAVIREPSWGQLPQWFSDFDVDLFFALIIVGLFSLIAYTTGVSRFYLHGLLLGVGNFATTILLAYNDVKFGWPIALAGLMIAIIGISVLIKFLQEYPLPAEEAADG
jgi:hypothetical protein